eukprot:225024_1
MGDSTLDELQRLSLVQKICTELENHVGLSDSVLAEFIIDLAGKNDSPKTFQRALAENGAEFEDSFVESMFRIVQRMRPKQKKPTEAEAEAKKPSADCKYPGLAMPNTEPLVPEATSAPPPKRDHKPSTSSRQHERDLRDKALRGRDTRDRDTRGRDTRDREDRKSRRKRSRSRSRSRDQRHRRRKSRSRSPQRHRKSRSRSPQRSGPRDVVLHGIYDGTVQNVRDFGCFVRLENVKGSNVEGLVHVGMIRPGRVNDIRKEISRNQRVKVKVMSMVGAKIGLSMRSVCQKTGEDLHPSRNTGGGLSDVSHNPSRLDDTANLLTQSKSRPNFNPSADTRRMNRLSSPERWEIRQLINSGALSLADNPDYEVEAGQHTVGGREEAEEELDIEINEDEPPFLLGQTAQTVTLSPIKVVRNPDGSLQRAALTQSALAKERRELRDQQSKQELDSVPRDIGRQWEDPMAPKEERFLAQQLHGMGNADKAVPAWKQQTVGQNVSYGRVTTLTLKEQRESLPIFKLRNQLMKAIHENKIIIVIGETGSGKTTQMTQYLAECGYASKGKIGCTQPRRVAAMSVAKRVSEEFGCRLGQEVGYTIRFEDCTSPETVIKYMTDGMLLREALLDRDMAKYSVIVLDEAHERTIHTDVLFGLLKACVARRPDLKLIVTSATLNAVKFSEYFNDCPIFSIPGRLFPVTVMYAKGPEADYLEAALLTVMQIHIAEPPGDILLFLTGKEEIDTSCEILFERMRSLGKSAPPLVVLPVYSALPSEMQTKIFEPAPQGQRKCVVATNIAEASLTIDGIYYVVDPGFVKQKVYNAKLGMDSLVITPISQASANQRAGRAGRTGPGKCFRLYTESAYKNEMLECTVPEIQRTNLGNTVLMLKAMGINDMVNFDFMDPPPIQTLISAMEQLYALNALDDEGLLTRQGRKMAEFPLEPQQSKTLIQSVDFGCSQEILTVVALLSADQIWHRPRDKQAMADQKRAKFFQPEGDHITLLAVYQAWEASKFSNMWCHENFIQARAMRRAQDVRKQLVSIMDRYKYDVVSCGKYYDRVRRAITSGYFTHAAKKDPQEGYKTLLEGQPVYIHPSSALFNHQPAWVVYHHLVLTSKEYMREVMAIEPKWLTELAPRLFKGTDPTKMSRRKRREKIEPLYDRYAKPNEWRLSRRRF